MEKLVILGTGNANATKCYNTCLALQNEQGYFLADAGGGNGILVQLEKAGIPLEEIHEIFLSHEHTDHILGMVWVIRMIAARMKQGKYRGNLNLYCHRELVETLLTIVRLTVQRIFLHPLEDKDVREILGYEIRFFDIQSVKAKQYGFTFRLKSGKRFTFAGDEPYRECEYAYVKDADWLLHEAFCLYSERERFKPYEKCHTTVKDACETAEQLGVKNLILYHTEDRNIARRKELYLAEGKPCFSGRLFVPEDLEVFDLA